jgi:predicted GNAT superfamily acetyltransferase
MTYSPLVVPAAPSSFAARAGVEVRPLRSMQDFDACVELQRDVWGFGQGEVVPSNLLHVVEYVGGIAAGAFDAAGSLLGFVFGVSGVRDGEIVHWSHMLAVRETDRNSGLGRTLKEYQRAALASAGVRRIFWSFDPLMAKNAHFNINRLGARVVEYVPDMYGVTTSPLHLGLPTDRLIVAIETKAEAMPDSRLASSDELLIEVPMDITAITAESLAVARNWRLSVRDQFKMALAAGYAVCSVRREGQRAFYVLRRG